MIGARELAVSGQERGTAIAAELRVARDDGEALDPGLGDDHAVERITVKRRQTAHRLGVLEPDRQRNDAQPGGATRDRLGGSQAPERLLDGPSATTSRTIRPLARTPSTKTSASATTE